MVDQVEDEVEHVERATRVDELERAKHGASRRRYERCSRQVPFSGGV